MLRPWLLLPITLLGLGTAGCGECIFEEHVQGVLRGEDGVAIAGALITTCDDGNRCEPGGSECHSTVTAEDGSFSLTVAQCRPSTFQCELRPLVVHHDGCTEATIRPEHNGTDLLDITLVCGAARQ